MSKLNDVPVGISHHCEITNNPAGVDRFLHQDILAARLFDEAVDFGARVALKSKMIESRFHFVLNNNQKENGIFTRRSFRPKPDIMMALESSVADNRETAKRSIEIN